MAKDSNENVVRRFIQNRESGIDGYGSVSSKNGKLFSYNAKIAEWDGGKVIVYNGWDGYSPTTSKHMTFLLRYLENGNVPYEATNEPKGKGRNKNRF